MFAIFVLDTIAAIQLTVRYIQSKFFLIELVRLVKCGGLIVLMST